MGNSRSTENQKQKRQIGRLTKKVEKKRGHNRYGNTHYLNRNLERTTIPAGFAYATKPLSSIRRKKSSRFTLSFLGKKTDREVSSEMINFLAEMSPIDVPYLGFSLEKWESIYKHLTVLYTESSEINSWTMERALERVHTAIIAHPDYISREKKRFNAWERQEFLQNNDCLDVMRSIVPENIRSLSVNDIRLQKPEVSHELASRLVNLKTLHLFHMPYDLLAKIHHADLVNPNGKYAFTDLDFFELRALYALATEVSSRPTRAVKRWKAAIGQRLMKFAEEDEAGTLPEKQKRNSAYTEKKKKRKWTSARARSRGKSYLPTDFYLDPDMEGGEVVEEFGSILPNGRETDKEEDLDELKHQLVLFRQQGDIEDRMDDDRENEEEKRNRSKSEVEDDDGNDVEEILSLVRALSVQYSNPSDLERALSSVFEEEDADEE
mmetsp:Transcript_8886/g.10154  ORF Transcript_8886/g.10154 Transcript_8886/m.10154 type:complete len:436 (+) Transcript_8886:244-1551(+)|eukprot:CAMPEP_0184038646 /NCGR_PEP_ID=MMETSP0955-20130417/48229_1 /TAXON_ID=627963 /ORGANISM="Aplanochytrium sp, Strain PBS07" /LENGTH=435 /DNA_ID=CAMNT_0026327397 /DNA_START=168 /DNA_END=1475 /DNA_ORIENTATION=+